MVFSSSVLLLFWLGCFSLLSFILLSWLLVFSLMGWGLGRWWYLVGGCRVVFPELVCVGGYFF